MLVTNIPPSPAANIFWLPKLKQLIEQTYLTTVQTNIAEYDKSASWLLATFKEYPIPAEFKEITELDLTTIQQLKRGAYLPFEDLGNGFANELAQVCEELEVDVHEVIRLANRHPRVNVLSPGPGVGGHCIPIDPWFLVENTKAGEFIRLARKINDERPNIVAAQALELLAAVKGTKVGILGVAYKANVDDCRETPADAILAYFNKAGVEVSYHDPYVPVWDCKNINSLDEMDSWADVLILVTDHSCYKGLVFNSPLLNTRA